MQIARSLALSVPAALPRSLAVGLWMALTLPAAKLTWAATFNPWACRGVVSGATPETLVLNCYASAPCTEPNCQKITVPGASNKEQCSCQGIPEAPTCCNLILVNLENGSKTIELAGKCATADGCPIGRCAITVDVPPDGPLGWSPFCLQPL